MEILEAGNESRDERKIKKRIHQTKPSSAAEISSKRLNLGSLPVGIFGTILKIDKRRTQTNGPEDKKWHRQIICVKKRRKKRIHPH